MSFRQDKLILLLDSGSSQQIRQTAAKQIARIARASFDAATSKPDAKPHVDDDSSITLHSGGAEGDAWNDTLETISKILALYKSKSSETRHAAAQAIGLLAKNMPEYIQLAPISSVSLTSQPIDLLHILKNGQTLLASAGREYAAKPLPGDKARRRKAMMASVGLGDAVGWGDDTDKVLDDEDDDMEDVRKTAPPSREPSAPPPDVFEGLSARQITMLKRKKGTNIMEEANKMRRLNEKAVGTGSSSAAPSRANSPSLPESSMTPDLKTEIITIDPGAKARAAEAGGQIDPVIDADGNPLASSKTLTMISGQSPWTTVLLEVIPDLHDTTWQTRHGSALVIMEILRSLGASYATAHPELYVALSRQLLSLLVLDRFGDFVGDIVIAPVRETAAQTLGVVLKYISNPGVKEIHQTLMGMVKQPWAKRGKESDNLQKAEKFAWEVRHAGLLGLKYEVAVRGDLLSVKVEGDIKPDVEMGNFNLLDDVVNAAILALGDADDDVRTVAASALIPIAETLASQLPTEELARLLQSLWDCLAEGGDELGSSTGAVMDLLGALISYSQVVALLSADNNNLVSRVYTFLRHPIASVRLSVANILLAFSRLSSIPRQWSSDGYFSFMFQNLVLEERQDVRDVSFRAFETSLVEAAGMPEGVDGVFGGDVEDWYSIVMTPIGVALDTSLFRRPTKATGQTHNVDKAMMAGDMSLISMDTALQTRIAGAKALALLRRHKLTEINDIELLRQFLGSASSHQTFLASVIIQEWALDTESRVSDPFSFSLGTSNPDVESLSTLLIDRIGSPSPSTYHEMAMVLQRIYSECSALLTAFNVEGKLSKDKIPSLPKRIDPLSNAPDVFSIETAHHAVTTQFDILSGKLFKNAIKNALPSLQERRNKVMGSVGYFSIMKEKYDVQVMAGIAGALVALKVMPPKFGPVIKNLMDGVKKEENEILQKRDAFWVAAFIQYTTSPFFTGRVNPSDKVVKNLFTFLCLDTSVTPVFSPTAQGATEGIITLLEERAAAAVTNARKKDIVEESEEQIASRMTRRGALETFKAMAKRFGSNLFEKVPKFWEGISGALLANFVDGVNIEQVDQHLTTNVQAGQDLIDALTSLRLIAPELDPVLHNRMYNLFSPIITALQSSFSVVRNAAAQCLAAMCDVMTDEGMKRVVDDVVPLVGDAKKAYSRQGAVEAIHRIIKVLDLKALPYVLFLIVPILGRMSDPDEHVRLLSTSTFASLVKMVPLEAGIPDPPGFSADLLAKRDDERKFLMQLLDGSKAEQYQIPVEVKAELRQYQKDGVSWLAFLAKYQLHGILCDDMGLGKSLQSICIIASKHHERAERHKATQSIDSAHLPSLIICPPTLTGHWYHEILKFTPHLRPVQYVGSAFERTTLRRSLSSYDVVISSYESIRSDISEFSKFSFLYCVLDEGHIIKNTKTKLAAAVKQIKAQHRLLLSGTPIQNNVLELWSLFDFLMPGFLGNERTFNEKFSKPILADREGKATPKERKAAANALEALHKQVLPFLLRRLKEDVLNDLPPKIIQDYYCELSPVQQQLYDEFSRSKAAEEAGMEIEKPASKEGQGHVFQSLQYLRKLCNHPALVLDGEPQRFKEIQKKIGGGPGLHDLSHAPKMEALRQLLQDCGIGLPPDKLADDVTTHRVLIFCQLRPMLDIIEKDLFGTHMPTVSYMRLDGSTDPRKRHAIVQTFNADPRIDVLLLTTSVGGLGLNLTGADTVIFVDHDWNPMKDLQAMDRAHRLGQRKVVNVYRLITRGTLEEKIMGLQRFKLNIASSVVTQQNAGLGSMNTGEVLDLFKVSAEGEPAKAKSAAAGAVSMSKMLEELDELPPEDEYAELSLSNFLGKV
ncbi:Helicase, putative [Cryptococcus gattii WM276]|uniref:Helicase, putative n=1 Tax=Cryptococcus gattii serotype B (strain WM276 / ATCC MYA-4071) TaxID=367775 RepID=E6R658_CRYGW|nr:Helicase, putative [Cryptococcus gattii WM276]ADV22686.1 Helicase, putative [Cryptococcus gattii WM276]KJE00674.1 TATA-binding protein-associated factor [Cryptococcus gattii NT-10]